ncbi:hypothetical protein RO3G_12410 [Rhizopus delemar RA 99-880]|uniref:Uncharacterized protein n=1 Tax=Rhizopus delemar (strain RA 99-880 / ATCC MYA-4621 / FGSC 9543 / NRRL 43880) TaxID=246409 RepID=I1CGW9_RHIO9|nr:hypothetical protein RO3G_12410 [Rhizopus delemar RA 99-880]|eukprot:EIE87699.1 hypothetical protein RO3G_12410 [Rhizopus delemar RA 99-880]
MLVEIFENSRNTNNITNISDDLKTFPAIPLPEMANTFRITRISFPLCFFLVESLSDDLSDVEDSCDIDEAENLRLAGYLENIQKYHSSFNSIYQQDQVWYAYAYIE